MSEMPPKRRRRRATVTPLDRIRSQQQSALAIQMERNAVLQYVGEQLAELNAMLRDAGFTAQQQMVSSLMAVPPSPQQQQIVQSAFASRPCAWCGRTPANPTNVGNGVVQDLCQLHAALQGAQTRPQVDNSGKPVMTNFTDAPRPLTPPNPNVGKVVMHPIEADVRQAQQAEAQANGTPPPPPQGFEVLVDGEA